jgi:anti-sigma factor RsiW
MTCEAAAPLLAAAADGMLDDDRRERLDAHLAGCGACRTALADQIAVREWLARTPEATAPPDFRDRVNARIDDGEGLLGVADFRAWTLRLAPLAALMALAALLGFGAARSTTSSAVPPQASFAPSRAADWQRAVSGNALLEAALRPPASGDAGDVDVR